MINDKLLKALAPFGITKHDSKETVIEILNKKVKPRINEDAFAKILEEVEASWDVASLEGMDQINDHKKNNSEKTKGKSKRNFVVTESVVFQWTLMFLCVLVFVLYLVFNNKTYIAAARSGNQWSLINQDGKVIKDLEDQYDTIGYFTDGLAPVEIDGKFGYIDTKGKLKIEALYDDAVQFDEGIAFVEYEGSWQMINTKGSRVSNIVFDDLAYFHDGFAFVIKNGDYAVLNKSGKIVVDFQDAWIAYGEGFFGNRVGDLFGFVDRNGKQVIEPQFESIGYFNEGYAPVEQNGKWGIIDTTGNFTQHPKYDSAFPISEGLMAYEEDDYYGFVDVNGFLKIEPHYDYAYMFRHGRSVVTIDGDEGLINTWGEVILQPIYDNIIITKDANAFAQFNGTYKLYDGSGQRLNDESYDTVESMYNKRKWEYLDSDQVWLVTNNDKCGLLSSVGETLIYLGYDEIQPSFIENCYLVNEDGQWGMIDVKKGIQITPTYDYLTPFYGK